MAFNLGTIFAEIGVNTAKLDQGLMAAQTKLATADKSISGFGQKLTASSTKLMVAGGLMAGSILAVGVASVKMASQFETSMRNVNSISKLSETEFKALGEAVVGISKKFPQTAKELADGLYDIASSGFSGAAGLKVLEASAMAASAGMTNTATSAKGITAVLNAFGLEADQAGAVADTMFRTVDKGVITFEELSSTVGDWVGMGKAAGLGFNELSGAIAYMTTKGINASEAGTSLQRLLTGIIKPSDAMAAAIKNAGFESGEMMLKTLGLTGSMKVLNDETGGSITKLIELIPEIRGVRGANALLGSGYESLTKFMGDFVDTTGSAAIALKEQSKSLDYQLKLLKNSATAIGIEIGNRLIPSITKYVTAADGMTAANTELIASNIILAMKIGGAVAGVLLLSAAYGKVLAIVGQLAGAGATVAGGAVAVAGGVGLFNMAQKLNELSTVISNTYRSSNDLLITLQAIAKLGLPTQLVDFFVDWTNRILGTDKAIGDVIPTTVGWGAAMAETNKNLTANNSATTEAIIATQDHENAITSLMAQYPELTRAQAENKIATEENTSANKGMALTEEEAKKAADELTKATDSLTSALSSGVIESSEYIKALDAMGVSAATTEGAFEALLTDMFRTFNIQGDLDEATKEYDKAMKALITTHTHHQSSQKQKLEATINNTNAQNNLTETTTKYNEVLADSNSTDIDKAKAQLAVMNATEGADSSTKALNDSTKTYTTTSKATEEEIKKAVATMEKLNAISLVIYEDNDTSIGQQKEMQEQYIKRAFEAEALGATEIENILATGVAFGLTAQDIIDWADKQDKAIDYATRLRYMGLDITTLTASSRTAQQNIDSVHGATVKINADISDVSNKIGSVARMLSDVDGRTANTYVTTWHQDKFGFAMGGIVGMASGGVVMPQAASGMVVPQTGRAYPIIAHEYEDIVNTSQQRNLAEWIMGKANSRPDGNGRENNQPIQITNLIEFDGRIIYEKTSEYILDKTDSTLRGVGIK
ncbi:MAG: phage tail tape measure protein [Candidatus Humimicrobiaceae bacterium]